MRKRFYLAKNIIKSNFCELFLPYRFTYIVTYKCQFRCSMCNIWQKKAKDELTIEEIERFFKVSNNFSWINLSGGEIFLRKDIYDIIKIMEEHCKNLYILDFPTNGFSEDVIIGVIKKILQETKIPKIFVTVSIDGPETLHDSIRDVNGAWKQAVKTYYKLKALKSKRFDAFFGFTIQLINADKFEDTVSSIRRVINNIQYNDFHLNIIQFSEHYYNNKGIAELPDNKILWQALNSIRKLRRNGVFNSITFIEERYQSLSKKFLLDGKMPLICQALGSSFFMDPAGTIFPCSIYNRPIGNIKDYDYNIRELWNDSYRKSLRSEIIRGECPKCWSPCEAYQSILANLIPKSKRVKS